jgi:hypothetical protein
MGSNRAQRALLADAHTPGTDALSLPIDARAIECVWQQAGALRAVGFYHRPAERTIHHRPTVTVFDHLIAGSRNRQRDQS